MEARVYLNILDCLSRPIRSAYKRQVYVFLDILANILASGGIK